MKRLFCFIALIIILVSLFALPVSAVELPGHFTLTNLIANGDFTNGTTGWSLDGSTNAISNAVLVNTSNGTKTTPATYTSFPIVSGNNYYIKLRYRVTNAVCTKIRLFFGGVYQDLTSAPAMNQWYEKSVILSPTFGTFFIYHIYSNLTDSLNANLEVQYVLITDLTASFGSGQEPTATQLDQFVLGYFSGVKDFVNLPASEKTLFDINKKLEVISHSDEVLTSIYVMTSFVVCVILPLMGLIWFLIKIFQPFLGKIL